MHNMKTTVFVAALVLVAGIFLAGCAEKGLPAASATPSPAAGGGSGSANSGLMVDNLNINTPDLETPSVEGNTGFENADVDV